MSEHDEMMRELRQLNLWAELIAKSNDKILASSNKIVVQLGGSPAPITAQKAMRKKAKR